MINRLKDYLGEPEERQPAGDYFVVGYQFQRFFVTREVAEHILSELDRSDLPRWIRFEDLTGAEIAVRTRKIEFVSESTAAARQSARDFERAHREEDEADRRPWEDD